MEIYHESGVVGIVHDLVVDPDREGVHHNGLHFQVLEIADHHEGLEPDVVETEDVAVADGCLVAVDAWSEIEHHFRYFDHAAGSRVRHIGQRKGATALLSLISFQVQIKMKFRFPNRNSD